MVTRQPAKRRLRSHVRACRCGAPPQAATHIPRDESPRSVSFSSLGGQPFTPSARLPAGSPLVPDRSSVLAGFSLAARGAATGRRVGHSARVGPTDGRTTQSTTRRGGSTCARSTDRRSQLAAVGEGGPPRICGEPHLTRGAAAGVVTAGGADGSCFAAGVGLPGRRVAARPVSEIRCWCASPTPAPTPPAASVTDGGHCRVGRRWQEATALGARCWCHPRWRCRQCLARSTPASGGWRWHASCPHDFCGTAAHAVGPTVVCVASTASAAPTAARSAHGETRGGRAGAPVVLRLRARRGGAGGGGGRARCAGGLRACGTPALFFSLALCSQRGGRGRRRVRSAGKVGQGEPGGGGGGPRGGGAPPGPPPPGPPPRAGGGA